MVSSTYIIQYIEIKTFRNQKKKVFKAVLGILYSGLFKKIWPILGSHILVARGRDKITRLTSGFTVHHQQNLPKKV